MANKTMIDVRMQPKTDDGTAETGEVEVRVSDDGGSPLTDATVELASKAGDFRDEKTPGSFGKATFADVTVQDYLVTISHPDHQTLEVDLAGSAFGSTITRGY